MLKRTISLIICIFFIAVGVAQAQVSMTYSARGKQHFTITIPDNWRVNVGSEKALSQLSENESEPERLVSAMPNNGVPLWFGIWVPEELENIKDAKKYIASLGLELLDDVITTERKFDTLNSMEMYYVSGTGKKRGKAMDFRAAFFQISPASVAIAIYIGPHETMSSHGDELVRMIGSLEPVNR